MKLPSKLISRLDKVDLFSSLLLIISLLALPLMVFQPNRITSGTGQYLFDIYSADISVCIIFCVLLLIVFILIKINLFIRIHSIALAMIGIFCLVGFGAERIIPEDSLFGKATLGSGCWVVCVALWLVFANTLLKLKATPLYYVTILIAFTALFGILLSLGIWDNLALLQEYKNEVAFWDHGIRHIMLSLGSLIPAILVGVPLGVLCSRSNAIKAVIFPTLNILQTIPSLAMFGILMIPLAYIAIQFPILGEFGIRGIGAAPAVIALFFYSLLPIVLNTTVGIDKLDVNIVDAAKGMGMSRSQRLLGVELPLAMPVILTGIRIVLIQNVGIVAVAGLIGGGGFGTYIFKGLNQSANELVMLGAIPTLYLALSAAVLMDNFISYFQRKSL